MGSSDWGRNVFSMELCGDTVELSVPYLIITLLIWLHTMANVLSRKRYSRVIARFIIDIYV